MTRIIVFLFLAAAYAPANTIHFQINTAPLTGMTPQPAVVFDLIDGDGVPNHNVFVGGISLGGGSPAGPALLAPGASGNASTGFTLTDSTFFVEAVQPFNPGSHIGLYIDFVPGFAGGTPDSFTITLLDGNGLPIPTSDPLGTDTLLAIDLRDGTWQVFSSSLLGVPDVTGAPEPASLSPLGLALIGLSVGLKRHTGRAR